MPEKNITNNTATIYSADLLYEQNCKCGQATVLESGETWSYEAGLKPGDVGYEEMGHKVWKIVALAGSQATGANALESITADTIDATDCAKICTEMAGVLKSPGWELKGLFTQVTVMEGVFILYKDCNNS